METALGKLVWRSARNAHAPAKWIALLRVALAMEKEQWDRLAPLGQTAMEEAKSRLGEIMHALYEGELALSSGAAARQDRQPAIDQSSWL
jgi:hypothetical protein